MEPINSYLFNSNDRINGTVGQATYNLQGGNKYKYIQLQNFSCLNTILNFKFNNSFSINDGAAAIITIPSGTYDTTSFAATLQTLLNSAGLVGTYTVTIDPTTLKLNITSTAAFVITWIDRTNLNYPPLWLFMGWSVSNTLPTPTGATLSLDFPFAVYLINLNKIGILVTSSGSSNVNALCSNTSNSTNSTFIVDLPVSFGFEYSYRPQLRYENLVIRPYSNKDAFFGGLVNITLYDYQTGLILDDLTYYQLQISLYV